MKKMMKKALSVILVVVIVLTAAPLSGFVGFELPEWLDFSIISSAATSGTCGENVTWSFDESTGTLTISGTGAMYDYENNDHRPWKEYKADIINIVVSDGVTSTGKYAFNGLNIIDEIYLGDDVDIINSLPLFLKSICVSANNKNYCSENGVLFDKDKTTLLRYPINCNSRESYVIPDSVHTISKSAFYDHYSFLHNTSSKLKKVIFGENVTVIEERAFGECRSLEEVYLNSELKQIGELAFGASALNLITIPDKVIDIGNSAFYGCTWLKKVVLGKSVETIGEMAFQSCESLESITIHDNLKSIGNQAFARCYNLKNINYTGTQSQWNNISIGTYAFYQTNHKTNYNYIVPDDTGHTHNYSSVLALPTCTEQGYATYTCSCGDSYISDYVPATGHNFVNGICTYCNSNNPNEPTDPDISPDENLNGLYVFSDNISLSYLVGDGILLAVTQMEDGVYTIPEKVSISFTNSSIVRLITIYDYNDLKNSSLSWLFDKLPEDFKNCCFIHLEAKKEGMTEFVLTNSDTKDTFRSYLTVSNDEYATFRADNVPTGVLDGEQYNYIIDAMVVTDFICEKTGGGYNFKMNIYNQQYSLGVVEVYNADGTLRQVEKIDKFTSSTNVKGVFLDGYYLIKSFAKGELMTFKGSQIAKENKIEVFVPQDGFIRITNDSAVSTSCYLLNLFDIILSAGDVISGTKALSAEQIDIVGKEVIKKFISNTYYLETAKKYQENMSKLAAEKITESVALSLISQAGDIAEELLMEIDLDFGDICKEALGTSFEIAEDIFTKVSGPAGLALSGMMTLQKVMNYVTQMSDWMNTTNNQAYYCIMTPSDSNYSSGILTSPDGIKVDTQGNVSSEVILQTVRILKGDETTLSLNEMSLVDDYVLYDISLVKNGQEVQPNGSVVVYLNVPSGFGEKITVFRQVNDLLWEEVEATVENGIIRLEIDHFCKFAFVSVGNFEIQTPSRTEIRNKDGIILHANVEGNAPADSYVRWESSNGNFDKSADGSNLKIIAKNKGYTTFTAILYDADGNELARDSVEMYSKSGFFDKIGGFFRSLFGSTKIYEN